ncbi:MAG: cysteine desulfurase [Planctomycetales bacterium]|nr:cysteine desulfurase [Planctomycetales bacterium]
MQTIYLDYNATTPVEPGVVEEMLPFFSRHFGNPSSLHRLGRAADEAIETARQRVAQLIGADSDEIVFTSGGTESNNLALFGVMRRFPPSSHFIVSAIEHPAVAQPTARLRELGYKVTVVGCDSQGVVFADRVADAIQDDTRLVSVMLANNEVGTVQPLMEIAEHCRAREIPLHTDAAQAIGKVRVHVSELDVDLLTIAGHKMYAPKGVGALYVRRGTPLQPFLRGADHEAGLRPGTENTPYLVGLGFASQLAAKDLDLGGDVVASQRDQLQAKLVEQVPGAIVHGGRSPRLPNTLSISFPGVTGQRLLEEIPELCASTGAACHSGEVQSSATLSAMGVERDVAAGTIRLSLGRHTTDEEAERAANLLTDAWERLSRSPLKNL